MRFILSKFNFRDYYLKADLNNFGVLLVFLDWRVSALKKNILNFKKF